MNISSLLTSKDINTIIRTEEAKSCFVHHDAIYKSPVGIINGREVKCWSKCIRNEKKQNLIKRTKTIILAEVINAISNISAAIFSIIPKLLLPSYPLSITLIATSVIISSLAFYAYAFIRYKLRLIEFGTQAVLADQKNPPQEIQDLEYRSDRIPRRENAPCSVLHYLDNHPVTFNSPNNEPISILSQDNIPEEFHEDYFLSLYTCPLTEKPIRYPVREAHSLIVYESQALINWVTEYSTSPSTGKPLALSHIRRFFDAEQMINTRLRHFQNLIIQAAIQEIEADYSHLAEL